MAAGRKRDGAFLRDSGRRIANPLQVANLPHIAAGRKRAGAPCAIAAGGLPIRRRLNNLPHMAAGRKHGRRFSK
jgi:hypothetical protein